MLGSEQRKSIGTWHQSSNTDIGLTAPVCELNYVLVSLIPSLIFLALICFWQYLHKYRVTLFKEKLDEFEWERNGSKRLWPCPLSSHSSPRPQRPGQENGVWRMSTCPLGPSRQVVYRGDFRESQTGLGSCLALPFAKGHFLKPSSNLQNEG